MKHLTLRLLFLMFLFQGTPASAIEDTLNNLEEATLLKAIEDYRFSDLGTAITALNIIHKKHPNHLKTIRYLALAHRDSGDQTKAASMFKLWISKAGKEKASNKKFAYLGAAKAETALRNYENAIILLQQWVAIQPNDLQSQIRLADALVRSKSLHDADSVLNRILNNNAASQPEQAAVWYYKSWIAYLNFDSESVQKFAKTSLSLDNKGIYATPAKNLMASPPLKKLGFSGAASLSAFYSSNVELLPDVTKSTGVGDDSGLETSLMLNWGLKKVDINYSLTSINHKDHKDFDMLFHLLSTPVSYNAWQFLPTLEAVSLNSQSLYQGFGLGIYYSAKDWNYHYAAKVKTFSDSFGDTSVDLSRLSGINYNIGVSKRMKLGANQVTFSSDMISEQTDGDATHNKTDSFLQIGAGAQMNSPLTDIFLLTSSLNVYSRNYEAADTSILIDATTGKKRSDIYYQIGTSAKWTPFSNKNASVLFNISYQDNNSNYDSGIVGNTSIKSYSAWKVGSSFSQAW